MNRSLTPSQTVGPFFTLGLIPDAAESGLCPLIGNTIRGEGEAISITGRVLDGAGKPVGDAMIEIAQADGAGLIDGVAGPGFARTGTDSNGSFTFHTIKPGPLGAGEAPYISLAVFMRGLLRHVFTRIYFADEAANASDPVFSGIPESRRTSLLARRIESADDAGYRFDIHVQGENETVFFEQTGQA